MSDPSLAQASQLLESLRSAVAGKKPTVGNYSLTQLKIVISQWSLYPPFNSNDSALKQRLSAAREAYELGVLLAVHARDLKAFQRNVAQLRPYYYDYRALLAPSTNQSNILALYLLSLLVEDKLSDFHSELELLYHWDTAVTQSQPVKYVIELEQLLTEGCYHKILTIQSQSPVPEFDYFISSLLGTVRERIADASELAYDRYPVSQLGKLLMLESEAEVTSFINAKQWKYDANRQYVIFAKSKADSKTIDSLQNIGQQLLYATEMERIV